MPLHPLTIFYIGYHIITLSYRNLMVPYHIHVSSDIFLLWKLIVNGNEINSFFSHCSITYLSFILSCHIGRMAHMESKVQSFDSVDSLYAWSWVTSFLYVNSRLIDHNSRFSRNRTACDPLIITLSNGFQITPNHFQIVTTSF